MPSFYYGGSSIVNAYYGSSSVYAIYFGSNLIYGGSSPTPTLPWTAHLASEENVAEEGYMFVLPSTQTRNTYFADFSFLLAKTGNAIECNVFPDVITMSPNLTLFSHLYVGTGTASSNHNNIYDFTFSNYISYYMSNGGLLSAGGSLMRIVISGPEISQYGGATINFDVAYSWWGGKILDVTDFSISASASAGTTSTKRLPLLSYCPYCDEFLSEYAPLSGHIMYVSGSYQITDAPRWLSFASAVRLPRTAQELSTPFFSVGTATSGRARLYFTTNDLGVNAFELTVTGGTRRFTAYTVRIYDVRIF